MEEKLDKFIPSMDVVAGVKRQLITAGVDPNGIPEDWLVTIIAAMNKWHSTKEGAGGLIQGLGFNAVRGKDDKEYEYCDQWGGRFIIPPEQVSFIYGAFIHGNPVSPLNISITNKKHQQCESCGVNEFCVQDIRNPSTDRLETLCNMCTALHDNNKVAFTTNPKKCSECTVSTCYHHPRRTQ